MKYEIFNQDIKLSKLGMGAMRLPQTEPGLGKPIDAPKAQALIDTLHGAGCQLLRYGVYLPRWKIRGSSGTGSCTISEGELLCGRQV